ncbi:D-alanyl-lipoteichoic acid biosynthesis protein DltB [Kurthia sibirica]|uniref:Teichoic acid D-alanyltransferase n=1 Tax=Kurthia sibirica TaxID=202750 RepID=A0A2U3AL43_9BACL|nr:D-alanyl-lipoteichoic acid biosynthesis protein DltB [Kurthia sibirica]PWI25250.1 D-alanyl-lipoteichoic acid biosynthesis protein DltB [Kurthia sibirica]GEK33752.1 protein DltB [Kurthia sibirica]
MIPYSDFTFFYIIGILLIPSVILGLVGRSSKKYNMFISVIILALIFGVRMGDFSINWKSFISITLFTVFQVLLIKCYHKYRMTKNTASIFVLAVILGILPLVLVKVLPFFDLHVFGFLGVSYITFKAVQIIMETRDGMMKKENIAISELIYFLLFFPTVSSGPIDRWKRFDKDFKTIPTKDAYREMLYKGINSIFLGFFYKFIVAFLLYNKVLMYLPDRTFGNLNFFEGHLMYMYVYSLHLFFDFAGYSCFAIGVSYIMGVKTPQNFNLPFISRNIKDFWNRWHMSLSFWFRDYVYMRFVFWMTKKKWIKNRFVVSYIGYFLLFFLMGIWHGLELHFVVYGLYHALLIICFDKFERWNKKKKIWKDNKWTHALGIIITFHVVCFGFYIFSGTLF